MLVLVLALLWATLGLEQAAAGPGSWLCLCIVLGCSLGRTWLCLWFLVVWPVLSWRGLGLHWQCSWTGPWLQGAWDRNWGWDSAVPDNCGSRHCEGSWEKGLHQSCLGVASPHTISNHPGLLLLWLLVTDGLGTILPRSPSRGASARSGPFVASVNCSSVLALAQRCLRDVPCGVFRLGSGLCCAWLSDVYQDGQHSLWLPSPALGQGEGGWGQVLGQARLSPSVVWWLVPTVPLTEQRACSNLCLLLCSSGQKRAFFGLRPELSH